MHSDRAFQRVAEESAAVPIPAADSPPATVTPSRDGNRLGARILTVPGPPAGRTTRRFDPAGEPDAGPA